MSGRTLSVRFNNRLGNQMFEYAFARALAERLKINTCYLVGTERNRLDCFCLSDKISIVTEEVRLSTITRWTRTVMGKAASFLEKQPTILFSIEQHFQWLLNRCGLFFCLDGYIDVKPERLSAQHIWCSGYFQSEQYFREYKELIFNDFRFVDSVHDSVRLLAEQISSCNSVCVHIRLGDYLALPNRRVCDEAYFSKAVTYMNEHVSDAHFFVFSDDPERAVQMLDLPNCTVIPADYTDQQSMYLGTLCRHHIISNSSFSWWMQYLAHHEDQIVIAPKRWMNDDTPIDIYQSHWTLV